jgi:rSAM/selenodomain-associated transferase 1
MASNKHLVIFAKAPRMGRVKTRLARDIGTVAAWGFFRHALAGLLRRLSDDPRWNTVIAVAPDSAVGAPVWPGHIDQAAQGQGDLGDRMQRAFDLLPPGLVIIVGADIPGITNTHIADAFRALGHHDAVFGQADDGGYWLVGLKRSPRIRKIFQNIRWSGPHALSDTLANLTGARIAMLEPLIDVDDGEDFKRWRASQKPR